MEKSELKEFKSIDELLDTTEFLVKACEFALSRDGISTALDDDVLAVLKRAIEKAKGA